MKVMNTQVNVSRLEKKNVVAIICLVLILTAFMGHFVALVVANPIMDSLPVITIRSDGSIDPSLAPISVVGHVYTLTSNITNYRLSIQCNNVTVDGAGYVVQAKNFTSGSGITIPANEVTVENFNLPGYYDQAGIWVTGSSNTIVGNNITGGLNYGVFLEGSYNNVSRNVISSGNYGIWLADSASNNNIVGNVLDDVGCRGDYNTFHLTNFMNCSEDGIIISIPREYTQGNVFDNGTVGNYWSNYDGNDLNNDGIGDTPYITNGTSVSDATITDHCPLIAPYNFTKLYTNSTPLTITNVQFNGFALSITNHITYIPVYISFTYSAANIYTGCLSNRNPLHSSSGSCPYWNRGSGSGA